MALLWIKNSIMFVALMTIILCTGYAEPTFAGAQDASLDASKTLIVAVYSSPPFAMRTEEDEVVGISIEQWELIAKHLGLRYEYRFTDMDGLLLGIRDGLYDVGIGDITITPLREELLDFTHPVTVSELGIAVLSNLERNPIGHPFLLVLSSFMMLVTGLLGLLLIAGFLIWFIEKKRNPDQFKRELSGLGDGIWWAAVTMTTVGYGDKTPRSLLGRIIGILWMFASIFLISFFTANASSIMTSARLHAPIQTLEELAGSRIGTAGRSWGDEYLQKQGVRCSFYPDTLEALTALDAGKIDAVVAEIPVLRYFIYQQFGNRLQVVGRPIEKHYLAIAVPPGNALREALNRVLLHLANQQRWKLIERRYMEGGTSG
jgi:ABC-type amino acid transport substrate-binding protein